MTEKKIVRKKNEVKLFKLSANMQNEAY